MFVDEKATTHTSFRRHWAALGVHEVRNKIASKSALIPEATERPVAGNGRDTKFLRVWSLPFFSVDDLGLTNVPSVRQGNSDRRPRAKRRQFLDPAPQRVNDAKRSLFDLSGRCQVWRPVIFVEMSSSGEPAFGGRA